MTRSFYTKALMVAAVAAVAPTAAQAQQTINFEGAAFLVDPNPALGVGDSLTIDFLTAGLRGAAPGTITARGANTLTGVTDGTTGTIRDLIARGSVPPGFENLPVSNFVTIGGYTFTLTSTSIGATPRFGPISLSERTIAGRNTVVADFNVAGTVTGGAFGTSTRDFFGTFSTQFPGFSIATLTNRIDRGRGATANSFSATFVVSAVPEPSTYALMASGVVMLGAFARRRRQQA